MNTATAAPSVTTKVIGPQEAEAMLVSYKYEHQRKPSKPWVKYLAEEMRAGTFDQSTTVRVSRVNGTGYLIDGQHRLMAVIESGLPQRFVIVENKESDPDRIADMYTRIDQNRKRTTDERFRTLDLADRWGITPTQVNQLGAAVRLIHVGWSSTVTSVPLHQDDHLKLMDDYASAYADFLLVAMTSGGIKTRGILVALRRAATVSVGIITFRYSRDKYGDLVDKFWDGAINDDGVANSDPRKFANRHMNETGMIGGTLVSNRSQIMTPRASSRILAACFNDYVQGKYRKQMPKIVDYSAPMLILGSPFNGKP